MPDSNNTDNVRLNAGTGGANVATDMVSINGLTSHAQYVKLAFGGSGSMNLVGDGSDVGAAGGSVSKPLPAKMFSSNNRTFSSTTWTGSSDALDVYVRGSGITIDANLSYQDTNFIAVAGSCSGTTPVSVAGDSGGAPVPIRVGVSGSANTMYVQGTGGGTPVGVCATDLDIRGITLNWHAASRTGTGDVLGVYLMQGLTAGASGANDLSNVDSVAIQGISGGYPVISGIQGSTGVAGYASVGVHAGSSGRTGAQLLTRIQSQGVTIGVDGHFHRVIGGAHTVGQILSAKAALAHGYTGSYGSTWDHIGIQGISNGMPVRSQMGAYTNEGFTAFGHSGDALLVSLKDGINVTTEISATAVTVENKAGGGVYTDGEYLRVAGTTSGTGFVPVSGNTAGTQGISLAGPIIIRGTCGQALGITTTAGGIDYPLNIRGLTAYANGQGDWVGITGTVNFRGLTAAGLNPAHGDNVGVTGQVDARLITTAVGITATVNGFTCAARQVSIRPLGVGVDGHAHNDIVGICGGVTVSAADLDIRNLSFTQDFVTVHGATDGGHGGHVVGISGMPSLMYGAGGTGIGVSGDALLVSLKDGVSVTANVSDTNFTISNVSQETGVRGLPIWVKGQTGSAATNVYNTTEVVGVKGYPVVVGGTLGGNVPINVQLGVTFADIHPSGTSTYSISGVTGEVYQTLRRQEQRLVGLETILGKTGAGEGDTQIRALSLLDALPADANAGNQNENWRLPSRAQVNDLVDAFNQTSGGDNFITVLADILETLNGENSNGLQEMVGEANGTVNARTELCSWKTPDTLVTGAENVNTGNSYALNSSVSVNIDGGLKLKAHPSNAGIVYIFNSSGVTPANFKTSGYPLQSGEELYIEISDIASIFVGAEESGNTIAWASSKNPS